jgi:MFS family permease
MGYKKLQIVIFSLLIMVMLGTVYSWSLFRIFVEGEFGVSNTLSGLPYMVSLAFYALAMMFAGPFLDHYSPRVMVVLGGIIIGSGWILAGFSRNILMLTVAYGVLIGIGIGMVYGVPMRLVARWYPGRQGLMVGLILGGFGVSPLITAPLAGKMIEAYGLMVTFRILGIFYLTLIPLLGMTMKNPDKSRLPEEKIEEGPGKVPPSLTSRGMMKTGAFKRLYLSFVLGTTIGLMIIGNTGGAGLFLTDRTALELSRMISAFAVFNGLGRPFFGWVTDRIGYRFAMTLSFVLIAASGLAMRLFGDLSWGVFFVSYSVFWFNLGGWMAIAPATTARLFGPDHYSQNYGIMMTAYGLGAILGTLSSGAIVDFLGGYGEKFTLIVVLALLGLWLARGLRDPDPEREVVR